MLKTALRIIALFVLGIVMSLSWTQSGQTAACIVERGQDPLDVLKIAVRHNVWIALDNSSSMQRTTAGDKISDIDPGWTGKAYDHPLSRLGTAKRVLSELISAPELNDANGEPLVNWGFVYSEKMSGSEDLAEVGPYSCAAPQMLESGLDISVVGGRVAAYIQATPNTTAYFDVGYWHAGAAAALRDLGYEPGQVLLAGFDLVPVVLDEMDAGYIQLTVDQQPYLQGFLPVMQIYLMHKYGLSAWDVNTGKALITPADVATVREYADEGVR